MKTKLIAALFVASSAVFASPRIAVGIGIGIPAAPAYYTPPVPVPIYAPPVYAAPAYVPPSVAYVAPAPAYVAPAPGYRWAVGTWYYSGGRRLWPPMPIHHGYWAAPRVHVYAGRGWRYR
jgi:hypothetical protein